MLQKITFIDKYKLSKGVKMRIGVDLIIKIIKGASHQKMGGMHNEKERFISSSSFVGIS